jgi:predicted secreted protein
VSLPAAIYPVMFWVTLLGVLVVGFREGEPASRPVLEAAA